jgi:uncharacterized protein (DUF169 family)
MRNDTDNTRLIGIAFSDHPVTDIPQLNTPDKYCRYIGRACSRGSFCISGDNVSCPLARFYLSIGKTNVSELARTLVGWSDAIDEETGNVFLKNASRVEKDFSHISFLRFPDPSIRPDIAIRICSAAQAQIRIQRYSANTGKRIEAPISGIGAACGECTAHVLSNHRPTLSLGCNGSRPGIGLQPGQLLLAAPLSETDAMRHLLDLPRDR